MTADLDLDFRPDADSMEPEKRAERLRRAVRSAGGNQIVADKAAIPLSTLGGYLAGGEQKLSNTIALAQACGVTVEWLATGHGPMKSADFPTSEPQLDTGAADQPWLVGERPAIDRLRQAINDWGGVNAVAQRSGVPAEVIAHYLQRGAQLSPELLAIADACRVTLDWLAAGRPLVLPEAPAGALPDFATIAKLIETSYNLPNNAGQDWSMERRIRWAWSSYLATLNPE